MTREEAINQLQDAKDGYKEYLSNDALDMAIEALEPKIGHWINKSQRSGCGILFVASECSYCGKKTLFNCDEFLYRYCPNCGAKMVEPQESGG